MREMKDSGIEWIGEIPKNWNIIPIRAAFEEITNKNFDCSVKNALKFTYGEIVSKTNFDADSDDYVANTIMNYTVVEPGTIIINGLNLNFDFVTQRIGLVKNKGVITSAYMAFRPSNALITSEFAAYVFKAYDGCKAFHNMGGGVRKILNFSELKKYYVAFPSLDEQNKIVFYINFKCAEIDALSADIQSEIETLEAYKQSVITEAVTKGLDKNVKMKDSGIEWVGEIPKNWYILNIKRIYDRTHPYPIGDGDHGKITPSDYLENGIPYIRVQNLGFCTDIKTDNIVFISPEKNASIRSSTLLPNDVLFAKTGATIGKTGIIPSAMPIANTTSHVGKITVSKEYNPRFIYYSLSSFIGYKQFWDIASQKSTRPELSLDEIKTIFVIIPSLRQAQDDIVAFLDQKCKEIDETLFALEEQLSILESYKKSLIYEYVTGKKEVPSA